jgi:dihydropyrimidine dehydrogenase (NAD+) subunit PreA
MVGEIARDPETQGLPISGIGGITTWRDAAEFIALGAGNVQVCTAAMVYGFKIIKDLTDGLSNFMDEHGYKSITDFQGKAVSSVANWQQLNLNHIEKAIINQDLCIQCGRCHVVCEDTSHQAIVASVNGKRHFEVKDEECVGCNLCVSICPVPDCITMRALPAGAIDARTSQKVSGQFANWTTHPNNPMREAVK